MGFDYVNAFHNLKQTELGSTKDLPREITNAADNPRSREVKAVEVHWPDAMARMITATFVNKSVRTVAPPAVGVQVNTGPIIGIVEWGTGGEWNRIEFNVPPGFVWRQNGGIGAPVEGINGVNITVPCSAIRVMGRNDSRQPPINDAGAFIGPDLDGRMGAFIAQGTSEKPLAPLERTYVAVSANGNQLNVNGSVSMGIPAFAKRVRFPRRSGAFAMDPIRVEVTGDIAGSRFFEVIAPSTQGNIELPPLFNTLTITNIGAQAITSLNAVFSLEL